jgi:hypothetical protein
MKRLYLFALVIVMLFAACATTSGGKNYSALAKEQSFDYLFPGRDAVINFAGLDEAYDYINMAQVKFTSSSAKRKAKGLAAKLIGPPLVMEQPVTVSYYINAAEGTGSIDLSKIDKPLETVIRDAVSASLVFLVFYEDRGVSLSNFHLKSGWRYSSNSQIRSFNFNNTMYETDYPVGWGIDKAFNYLHKKIN